MLDYLPLVVVIGLLVWLNVNYWRSRPAQMQWRYHNGRMRRKIKGQWQYRPATSQEQREHEAKLADEAI